MVVKMQRIELCCVQSIAIEFIYFTVFSTFDIKTKNTPKKNKKKTKTGEKIHKKQLKAN